LSFPSLLFDCVSLRRSAAAADDDDDCLFTTQRAVETSSTTEHTSGTPSEEHVEDSKNDNS